MEPLPRTQYMVHRALGFLADPPYASDDEAQGGAAAKFSKKPAQDTGLGSAAEGSKKLEKGEVRKNPAQEKFLAGAEEGDRHAVSKKRGRSAEGEDGDKDVVSKKRGPGGAEDTAPKEHGLDRAGLCVGSRGLSSLNGSGNDGLKKGGQNLTRTAKNPPEELVDNGKELDCNPYMDFIMYCRVGDQFQSSLWETPLVFHDKPFVLAKCMSRSNQMSEATVASSENNNAEQASPPLMDLSMEISAILRRHPGPVKCFIVDTSFWTDARTLLRWVKELSEKSIEKLVILNLHHSTSLIFPIEELQSSNLKCLGIGFMELPDSLDMRCFDYSSLTELYLICCKFDGKKLSWIVNDCDCLTNLSIGFTLQNIKINSRSLEKVQIWDSKASWFTIEAAPKLRHLGISIEPRRGRHTVDVSIKDAPLLRRFYGLQVPLNKMVILSTPLLREFTLSLSFGLRGTILLDILKCLPMLQKLIITRTDDIVVGEAIDSLDNTFVGLSDIPCVRSCLQWVGIRNSRGGPAELDFIRFILFYGSNLKEVCIELDKSCSDKTRVAVETKVRDFSRGSLDCIFRLVIPADK